MALAGLHLATGATRHHDVGDNIDGATPVLRAVMVVSERGVGELLEDRALGRDPGLRKIRELGAAVFALAELDGVPRGAEPEVLEGMLAVVTAGRAVAPGVLGLLIHLVPVGPGVARGDRVGDAPVAASPRRGRGGGGSPNRGRRRSLPALLLLLRQAEVGILVVAPRLGDQPPVAATDAAGRTTTELAGHDDTGNGAAWKHMMHRTLLLKRLGEVNRILQKSP